MSIAQAKREQLKAAMANVSATEKALEQTPEWKATCEAREQLAAITDETGEARPCDACGTLIFDCDAYSFDTVNSMEFCEDCTPTWECFLAEPEHFYRIENGDEVYYDRDTAIKAAEAHVASGGSMTDRFGLIPPECSNQNGAAR